MAEFASYLSKAHQSFAKPSIFDLLAQESLKLSLRPAFEFLTRSFATAYPECFGVVFKYSDEIFYSLLTLIEGHHLWKYNATFAESFYGLYRRNFQGTTVDAISLRQKLASLALVVVIPYLSCKFEKLYQKVKEESLLEQYKKKPMQIHERMLFLLFPYVDSLMEASKFACTLCYIINLLDYHCITYAVLRIRLTYSSQENEPQAASEMPTSISDAESLTVRIFRYIYQQFSSGVSFAIGHALPAFVFFLKFLEWWYSSENGMQNTMNTLPTPPPPKDLKCEKLKDLSLSPSQCPLCCQSPKNPTTLSKSGYVFCYACIYRFVDDKKQCPITGISCDLDSLVRIYF